VDPNRRDASKTNRDGVDGRARSSATNPSRRELVTPVIIAPTANEFQLARRVPKVFEITRVRRRRFSTTLLIQRR